MLRAILAAVLLAACTPTPSFGFDPIADDPSGLVLAARLTPEPDAAPPATLTIAAYHPDRRRLAEVFELAQVSRPSRAPGNASLFYALAPDDETRLTATRRRIAAWKREAPGTRGQFSLAIDSFGGPTRASIWLSPAPGAPFAEIARNATLP